ncbi:hypothetical protein LCGC14_1070170 [marine sediment metagenome]|uniref:Uncharacterized protein n=1 Tax=marine sediment metagenome TaxID=412755 RepID=A0A0F9QPA0_9ZZZZ
MEYKKYTEQEFNKWCKNNAFEDFYNLWEFIEEQDVDIQIGYDGQGVRNVLIIKMKMIEK